MEQQSARVKGARKAFVLKALGVGLCGALTLAASPAMARMDVWDLEIGSNVDQMPAWIEFKGYACGSNGGPPLQQLAGWSDFAKCPAEPSGLHEVYFEYDDEEEYIARAHEDIRVARFAGTVDKSFPVITSALFDDAGILQGIRVVTDPRHELARDNEWAGLRPREEHHLLGSYLAAQFNIDPATDCEKLPLGEGESPVGGTFVKMDCERVDADKGLRYVLQQRYLRKPGQADRDPHTGQLTTGQFESIARAEIHAADAAAATQ